MGPTAKEVYWVFKKEVSSVLDFMKGCRTIIVHESCCCTIPRYPIHDAFVLKTSEWGLQLELGVETALQIHRLTMLPWNVPSVSESDVTKSTWQSLIEMMPYFHWAGPSVLFLFPDTCLHNMPIMLRTLIPCGIKSRPPTEDELNVHI